MYIEWIGELLSATRKDPTKKGQGPSWGVSLDEPSTVLGSEDHSIRYEGMVLLLTINYYNFHPFQVVFISKR